MTTADPATLALYSFPSNTPIQRLECKAAFDTLTDNEKLYAWAVSQAAWQGALAVLVQTSPESPLIFPFLIQLFRAQPVEDLRSACLAAGVSTDDFDAVLMWAAAFFSNMGNYKSFGDTKFIPTVPSETFDQIVKLSKAYTSNPQVASLWNAIREPIYSLKPRERQLGLGDDKGISTYFSYDITDEDTKLAQSFMDAKGLSPYNTRFFKRGPKSFELRLASVLTGQADDVVSKKFLGVHNWQDAQIEVTRGDYSAFMLRAADYLAEAKKYAANEYQRKMIDHYVNSFVYGSIDEHIEGSRQWINDKAPIIETYIGFIESYRDPMGTRGEFEGFVAMVNKDMSARFQTLVNNAEKILTQLPWPSEFEKDKFLRPDFTSLDILTFSGSGIPAGINIPNYDIIRQSEGFKNVSLGNVLSARNAIKDIPMINKNDLELYRAVQGKAFEVQVALHELLGHGSGKLLQQDSEGQLNFDKSLIDPTTNKQVSCFYKPGETYDSVFGSFSSAYEECRAEAVGIYLCLEKQALDIFGHNEEKSASDIIYINWLSMVRAGLVGLEFFTPETGQWRQAHMQARFVLLRVMLEAGEGLVELVETIGEDGKPDCYVSLDRTKISTVGKVAIAKFLQTLQVLKSIGDVARASEFFGNYSKVPEDILRFRPIVLARQKPRPIFVQPVLKKTAESVVTLTEYDSSSIGVIKSMVDRYENDDTPIFWDIVNKDKHFFFSKF